MFYDDHGVVIDFGGIVSHKPVLIGKIDLNRIGGPAGLEALTQLVEAGAAKIGFGVSCLGDDGTVASGDENVIDLEQVLELGHFDIGRFITGIVGRHKCDACGARAIQVIKCLGVVFRF
ncbi:hypothetical protein [Collinsella sp. TM09-10AT]|uniref:hypothetical protein n=1 Tax=Collinsella sp. TM09-10AT TaxID=2292343 RepID=UPI0018F1F9E0|nr:hypothetical protein [Collinsella sp. TM09-10AT]